MTIDEKQDVPESDIDEMSMDEQSFEELFEKSLQQPVQGSVVKGTVIQITGDSVMVDIGYKTEGYISISEFTDADGNVSVQEGDEISAFVDNPENDLGSVSLSKVKADQFQVWDELVQLFEDGVNIEGTIEKVVKGGYHVNLRGITAFLPNSQVDLKPVRDPDTLVGEAMEFRILKHNRRKSNVVVSRRAILEEERDALRQVTMDKIEEGAVVKGMVKNITDYGAFIDLGGIDGLVHLTDLSWGKVTHPSQVVKIGDMVDVKILKYSKDDGKISLGIKQTKDDPWKTATADYPVGMKTDGRVVNITDYGAFVELAEGLEGLVHISEMSWTKLRHPSQKVKVDDVVAVMVLEMDAENRRISLGIKQAESNPWDDLEERYPKGSRVKGVVKNITDFGTFIGIEDGIDGLIHISDITWRKIKHPSEVFSRGEEVEAVVVNIDASSRRLSLSTKILETNPWEGVEERYKPGQVVEGRVTSIADFGAFVEMEEGLEGLVHISDLNRSTEISGEIFAGDTVEVEVLNVDPGESKIGLSIRSVVKGAKASDEAAAEETVSEETPAPEATPEGETPQAEADPEVEAEAEADSGGDSE